MKTDLGFAGQVDGAFLKESREEGTQRSPVLFRFSHGTYFPLPVTPTAYKKETGGYYSPCEGLGFDRGRVFALDPNPAFWGKKIKNTWAPALELCGLAVF